MAIILFLVVAYRYRRYPLRTFGLALVAFTYTPVSNVIPPRMFAYSYLYMSLLVENLYHLRDLDEAECVLLEYQYHGAVDQREAKSLATLILRYPSRPLRHPK